MTRQTPNLSRRKFIVGSAAAAGGGLALGFNVPFGAATAQAQRRAATAPRSTPGSSIKPDDTLRDPHRALGDGPGHAHRPRPARRRGARMRLEEGDDRVHHARRRTSRASASGATCRTGGSRGIRTLAGLRPPRRRGRAHDAAAGGGRRVEGAGRRAHRRRTASSRTPRSKRTTSYGKVAAAAAKLTPPDPKSDQAQGPEGLEDRRQAAEAARHRRQAQRQQGLRDRRQAARHAERRDQGLPGVRRQAR